MASYLAQKLENLIDRWQSRRKTIEISPPRSTHALQAPPTVTETTALPTRNKANSQAKESVQEERINACERVRENKVLPIQVSSALLMVADIKGATIYKPSNECHKDGKPNFGDENDISGRQVHELLSKARTSDNLILYRTSLATCPSLIYAIAVAIIFMCHYHLTLAVNPAENLSSKVQIGESLRGSKALSSIQKLAWAPPSAVRDRDRWFRIPSSRDQIRDQQRWRPPSVGGRPRAPYLTQALNRISTRIGARNTIRVHNAFRDLAWRILSSLSMPTPVIYELRRQHFYSPEEDSMNDSLFNKNTTQTIRSRRLLEPKWLTSLWDNRTQLSEKLHRAGDDDDDEPENFRDRLRMRIEDVVNLSRRSMFGRVIRLPSLFPFKRQEEDDERATSPAPAPKTQKVASRGVLRLLRRRRRKKESDRQMIQINGKQYYVDDEGQLKELKEKVET